MAQPQPLALADQHQAQAARLVAGVGDRLLFASRLPPGAFRDRLRQAAQAEL